jgi:hypothetical protein
MADDGADEEWIPSPIFLIMLFPASIENDMKPLMRF